MKNSNREFAEFNEKSASVSCDSSKWAKASPCMLCARAAGRPKEEKMNEKSMLVSNR